MDGSSLASHIMVGCFIVCTLVNQYLIVSRRRTDIKACQVLFGIALTASTKMSPVDPFLGS